LAPAIELDAGSAQQSAMIRGGGGGARHQHRIARMDSHVHLLSARVGVIMETYWRPNDETFEQERNEHASPLDYGGHLSQEELTAFVADHT
jgi:hypothetical protein